jgi:hypothetical protein
MRNRENRAGKGRGAAARHSHADLRSCGARREAEAPPILAGAGRLRRIAPSVALHLLFKYAHMLWFRVHLAHWHLMRAPRVLDAVAIDFLRAGSAF